MPYGDSKQTDRKLIKETLVNLTLLPFFAAVCGEKNNSEVRKAVKALGYSEFFETTSDVLRSQVSGTRGRPALEEKPIHTMLKAMREASRFKDSEGNVDEAKATKIIAKALKQAEREQQVLQARRALFKPSKRIQGTGRRLPILDVGEAAKA